eukprot:scaffold190908_cov67-Attheya_sp.AAC.3
MKIGALNDPALVQCASTELQQDQYDPNVILCAIHGYGMALKYVNFTVEINLDMAMTAVCNKGMALQYIPEHMRDYVIVRAALLNPNSCLKKCSITGTWLRQRSVAMVVLCNLHLLM